MQAKSIAEILDGLVVDSKEFAKQQERIAGADKHYVIIFTPRSGSSWLTSILSATERLGRPEEYINPQFLRDVAKSNNSIEPKGILSSLRRRRKTSNGVFGIEATATHISIFGEQAFFESFDADTKYFYLWRDNLIAQGISLYRAVETQHFHSSEGTSNSVPNYDPDQIIRWTDHVLEIENANFQVLARRQIYPRVLRYEDIIRSRNTTISIIADTLKVGVEQGHLALRDTQELKKIGDEWNAEAGRSFSRDRPNYVADLMSRRLIKAE